MCASSSSGSRSGPSPTRQTTAFTPRSRSAATACEHDAGVLDAGHAADPADDERIAGDAVQAAVVDVLRLAVEALGERDPEPDDDELLGRRNAELDEVVAHLRAHGDERVGGAGERPLDLAEHRRPQWAEVPAEHVAVERVDDDLRPRVPGEHRGRPRDRTGLRRVRVEDVRTRLPHDFRHLKRRACVVERGDLALDLRDADDRDSEPVRQEGHGVLAAREAPGDECRLVAEGLEPRGEVRDVDRRPAHVQARDDAQDANRLVPGHAATLSVWAVLPLRKRSG